jgi:hypothetical protein
VCGVSFGLLLSVCCVWRIVWAAAVSLFYRLFVTLLFGNQERQQENEKEMKKQTTTLREVWSTCILS